MPAKEEKLYNFYLNVTHCIESVDSEINCNYINLHTANATGQSPPFRSYNIKQHYTNFPKTLFF